MRALRVLCLDDPSADDLDGPRAAAVATCHLRVCLVNRPIPRKSPHPVDASEKRHTRSSTRSPPNVTAKQKNRGCVVHSDETKAKEFVLTMQWLVGGRRTAYIN